MENFKLNATQQTPLVDFNIENNLFIIEGVSMPEDSIGFYAPIFSWLGDFALQNSDTRTFEMKLKYFNTASAKMIIEFCHKIAKMNCKILWTFEDDDEDLEEIGNDLKELIGDAFISNPIEPE